MTRLCVLVLAFVALSAACSASSDEGLGASSTSIITSTSVGVAEDDVDLPGAPVARQFPWGPDEELRFSTQTHLTEGLLGFEEPGCLLWQATESGVRIVEGDTFGVLALPGTRYEDGLVYASDGRSDEWAGEALGPNSWLTREFLEEGGYVDPATPLDEMCPGRERFVVFTWRDPGVPDN